jgi:hypothetical protein
MEQVECVTRKNNIYLVPWTQLAPGATHTIFINNKPIRFEYLRHVMSACPLQRSDRVKMI